MSENRQDPLGDVEVLPPRLDDQQASGPLEAIERASIDMQIATAHRFPRKMSKVKDDMLSIATLDEETAQACFYTLPRGGKTIQGPSVRLAEIAVSCYGNLRAGFRVIETVANGEHPHVVVQAVAHDLEKNVFISIEKRRRITAKKKNAGVVDEDDINLACNACGAIAFRDAVFKVVPQALIRPVYLKAKQLAVGDVKSLAAKRTAVVDRLKQMGVTEDRIFAVVEARKIDDIDLSKLEILIGLGTAIKEGETTLEAAFPPAQKPIAAANVPTTPTESKPSKKGKAEIQQTVQEKLAAFVESCGKKWEHFIIVAISQGWLPDSCEANGFADLEGGFCESMLANSEAIKTALASEG
jgi:hypothetical protein